MIVRVDNRLIHGQIAVNWKAAYKFETIVVPDERLIHDSLNRNLMRLAARAAHVHVIFTDMEHVFQTVSRLSGRQILLICRSLAELKQVVEKEVKIKEVSIWNQFKQGDKKKVYGTVYMDEEDDKVIAYLKSRGIRVYLQETPYSKKIML